MEQQESLMEPLVGGQEGYEFVLDEALLKELAALNAAEAPGVDGHAAEAEHVEDEDVYKMKELIREKPKDVLQYIEEEGVVKLGEFEVQDAIAFRAFGKDSLLTVGTGHYEVDWERMWREQLAAHVRPQELKSALGWSTKVTLEAHVVNLRDAAAEGAKGLLHPLLKRFQAHACSATVFALPAVQAVIQFKWTSWARTFLLYELLCYCLWLGCFTAFTLLFQYEDWTLPLWKSIQDRYGFLALVFSLCSLLPMSAFVYMELCTIAAYGWGWVRPWNIMDMVSYMLQVVICVLHLQRSFVDEGWFSVLVATQQVLLWLKLHYFARAFNPVRNNLVDIVKILVDDMKYFLGFLTLTMVGFGLAFFALFRQDRSFPDFANIWHSFASMFSYMLAMFDYNVFYNSTNPTAAMVLFIVFEFVMNVLLLNVLIASMTTSFSKIAQDEGLRLLHSKAEIIDELEATLPAWTRSASWYPAFVHILKIHPDATYEVNLNSVWSGIGLMENNLLGAQQETRLRVEELEDRMSKLHKKLDIVIKLFSSNTGPSQALALSRQATLGVAPSAPAPAAGHSLSTHSSLQEGALSSWQVKAPHELLGGLEASRRSLEMHPPHPLQLPAYKSGPMLRHMPTALGLVPEQPAAVSGHLAGLPLHRAGQAGGESCAGVCPGSSAQESPAVWDLGGPTAGAGVHGHIAAGISQAAGGTRSAVTGTAAGAHRGGCVQGTQVVHRPEQLQRSPFTGDAMPSSSMQSCSSGLFAQCSGHLVALSQQQAWQLLMQQQQHRARNPVTAGSTSAAVLQARKLQQPSSTSWMTRSQSL